MDKGRVWSAVATMVIMLGVLFVFLPEGQKVGPMIMAIVLTPAFWWLGERAQQKAAARAVPPGRHR